MKTDSSIAIYKFNAVFKEASIITLRTSLAQWLMTKTAMPSYGIMLFSGSNCYCLLRWFLTTVVLVIWNWTLYETTRMLYFFFCFIIKSNLNTKSRSTCIYVNHTLFVITIKISQVVFECSSKNTIYSFSFLWLDEQPGLLGS